MLQEAQDFLDESEALHALVAALPPRDLERQTDFKGWPIAQVIRHLHVWNRAAALSISDPALFEQWLAAANVHVNSRTLFRFEEQVSQGLSGRALVEAWRTQFRATASFFSGADPKARVAWPGQTMSARSSITARLMETWAHGQEIYDLLGQSRVNTDRIRGIAVLGVNTYAWTFRNRGRKVPEPVPFVELIAPSGARWRFGDTSISQRIEGAAEEFCQVVTQTRNIADTGLRVQGPNAVAWMAIAQCFAGQPEDPPPPGSRRARSR